MNQRHQRRLKYLRKENLTLRKKRNDFHHDQLVSFGERTLKPAPAWMPAVVWYWLQRKFLNV